jgi:hypothetical protein
MQAAEALAGTRRPDYGEFLHTPVGTLRSYVDADSRPLCGEAAVDDPVFRASLEQRRCRYAGSRQDHPLPMNASALKQMTKNWDRILATAAALRRLCAAGGGASVDEELAQGMRVACAGVFLPLYLLYRGREPMANGEVPGFVSGLHKASIDIATSIQLMLVEGFASSAAAAPHGGGAVRRIEDFVESEGLLVGHKGVCAGPPQLIHELLEAMLHGRGRHLDQGAAALEALGDLGGVRAYADELLRIWIGKYVVVAYNGRLMDALEARLAPGAFRAADFDARVREHRMRAGLPALISKVIARQERSLRALEQGQFARLLRALEPGVPSALFAHAAADWRDGAREPVERAMVAAARMEELALRFFAATETGIRAALGLGGSPRALSDEDMASVFGPSARLYLHDYRQMREA